MTKEENELLPGRTPQSPAATTSRKGYERIFDFIPPISLYQIGLVCCALYPRIAAGAIQFGSIVLEAQGSTQKFTKEQVYDRSFCISKLSDFFNEKD